MKKKNNFKRGRAMRCSAKAVEGSVVSGAVEWAILRSWTRDKGNIGRVKSEVGKSRVEWRRKARGRSVTW